jgi:hypothetical protein
VSRPSDRSHPAKPAWTPARIIGWATGGLITLITGTLVVGVVVHLVLRNLFHIEESLLLPYVVGFIVSAIYVAWLVARAVRRTK